MIGSDRFFIADSESNYSRNPGFKRGIRVVNIHNGLTIAFIADPEPNQDELGTSVAEGVAVDSQGNVYGTEVGPKALRKYFLPSGTNLEE